jgi:hypothetical protein
VKKGIWLANPHDWSDLSDLPEPRTPIAESNVYYSVVELETLSSDDPSFHRIGGTVSAGCAPAR